MTSCTMRWNGAVGGRSGKRWSGFEIAAMVLGFVVFWPVGLAILFYILWKAGRGAAQARERAGRVRDVPQSAQARQGPRGIRPVPCRAQEAGRGVRRAKAAASFTLPWRGRVAHLKRSEGERGGVSCWRREFHPTPAHASGVRRPSPPGEGETALPERAFAQAMEDRRVGKGAERAVPTRWVSICEEIEAAWTRPLPLASPTLRDPASFTLLWGGSLT